MHSNASFLKVLVKLECDVVWYILYSDAKSIQVKILKGYNTYIRTQEENALYLSISVLFYILPLEIIHLEVIALSRFH